MVTVAMQIAETLLVRLKTNKQTEIKETYDAKCAIKFLHFKIHSGRVSMG
jgi:hypothetical protein